VPPLPSEPQVRAGFVGHHGPGSWVRRQRDVCWHCLELGAERASSRRVCEAWRTSAEGRIATSWKLDPEVAVAPWAGPHVREVSGSRGSRQDAGVVVRAVRRSDVVVLIWHATDLHEHSISGLLGRGRAASEPRQWKARPWTARETRPFPTKSTAKGSCGTRSRQIATRGRAVDGWRRADPNQRRMLRRPCVAGCPRPCLGRFRDERGSSC
jgi:hypothetical protein